MTTLTAQAISVEAGCDFDSCAVFASGLQRQLAIGYELCSVLPAPESIEDWRSEHRTARKRADRAFRHGYRFAEIHRERYEDDIFAINTSLERRQGRQMTEAYRERQHFLPMEFSCSRHRVRTFGVLLDVKLVAYLWLYRSGELALVSSILGHGDHLGNDIMYLLVEGTIQADLEQGGFFVYNRHDSGTDGLRYFKERLGFEAREVEWVL